MSEPPTVGRFRLATPANWFDLDIGPSTSRAAIKRLVEARVRGDDPKQVELRRQLTELLQQAAVDAAANGGVFCSIYSGLVEGRPMSASLLASFGALGDRKGVDGAVDMDDLAAGLVAGTGPGTTVTETEVVTLEAGPAVRLRKRTKAEVVDRKVDSDVVQYAVPVPGGSRVLLLTFSTPTLQVADAFAGLFDVIAASLRWS
jgi:hypothetical protein